MAGRSSMGRIAIDVLGKVLRSALDNRSKPGARQRGGNSSRPATKIGMPSFGAPVAGGRDARRGQERPAPPPPEMDTADARPRIAYAPVRDDDADPGEIVWAWVPYEDDPSQGKDRPLLVIGHSVATPITLALQAAIEDDVAALALTSKDKDDRRHHHPLGTGPWDGGGRSPLTGARRSRRYGPDAGRELPAEPIGKRNGHAGCSRPAPSPRCRRWKAD